MTTDDCPVVVFFLNAAGNSCKQRTTHKKRKTNIKTIKLIKHLCAFSSSPFVFIYITIRFEKHVTFGLFVVDEEIDRWSFVFLVIIIRQFIPSEKATQLSRLLYNTHECRLFVCVYLYTSTYACVI